MFKTVIAENNDPSDRFCLGIVVRHDGNDQNFDPATAIRAAAAEYCATKTGQKKIKDNGGSFNWGDFVDHVPDTVCKKHGFTVFSTFIADIFVDHNEQLNVAD